MKDLSTISEKDLKPCPNCGSTDLKHKSVYIKCNKCLMEGPKTNGGSNDEHADHMDWKWAIQNWNDLPRFEDITRFIHLEIQALNSSLAANSMENCDDDECPNYDKMAKDHSQKEAYQNVLNHIKTIQHDNT